MGADWGWQYAVRLTPSSSPREPERRGGPGAGGRPPLRPGARPLAPACPLDRRRRRRRRRRWESACLLRDALDLPPWSSACSARQRPGALPCRCQTRALRTPSSQSTAARARSTAVSAPPSGSAGDNSFIPSAGGTPAAQLRLREGLGFAARRLPRGRLAEEEAAAAAHAFHQPAAAGAGGDLPEEPLPRHEHARGDRRVDQPHRGPRAGVVQEPARQMAEARAQPAGRAVQGQLRGAARGACAALRGGVPRLLVRQLAAQGACPAARRQDLPIRLQLGQRGASGFAARLLATQLHRRLHGALRRGCPWHRARAWGPAGPGRGPPRAGSGRRVLRGRVLPLRLGRRRRRGCRLLPLRLSGPV
nr:pituitary homeobox 3 isoform X1 [Macaca fascicularis]